MDIISFFSVSLSGTHGLVPLLAGVPAQAQSYDLLICANILVWSLHFVLRRRISRMTGPQQALVAATHSQSM